MVHDRGEALRARRKERNQGGHTHIFLMNRFNNRLDDIFHNTNMICVGLIAPDPHESPRLLLKVPTRLDDPVVILFFRSFHPVYGFFHVRILPWAPKLGLGPAERTAPTHHFPQTACQTTDTGRSLPKRKEGSTVLHGDRVVRSPLVQGTSVPA